MSERDESVDPDEVTLWAGRLRPWPAAAEPEPEGEDATRLVRRRGVDPEDSDDATQIVRRRAAPPEDDATQIVRRREPRPAASAGAVAAHPQNPPTEPDDATALVRRPAPAAEPDDATALVARPPAAPAEPAVTDRTELRATSRRAAAPRIAAPAHTERSARVPTGEAREIYRPRAVDPVVVERRTPVAAPVDRVADPFPDAAVAARRARGRRTRLFVVAAVTGLVLLAAAVAIVVLIVAPAGA